MCGRYGLSATGEELAELFELDQVPQLRPRFNMAPSQEVPILRAGRGGIRAVTGARWGLVPFWAKDPKIGHRLVNARCETLHERKAFRWALRQRRCLVPADGFYEWKKVRTDRLPHHIGLRDQRPFAMAGLWERWQGGDGRILITCAIVTTEPNAMVGQIHDRMPVILDRDGQRQWMNQSVQDPRDLSALFTPYDADAMEMWPVERHVNSPLVDGPQCRSPRGQLSLL